MEITDDKTLAAAIDIQWNELLPKIKESFLKDPFFDLHNFVLIAADNIENDSEFDKHTFVKNSWMKNKYDALAAMNGIDIFVESAVHSFVDQDFSSRIDYVVDELIDSPEYHGNAKK